MSHKLAVKDLLQRAMATVNDASRTRRRALTNKRFSIVSNDCWGAEVYKDLGLPYETPLIGTYVMGPCYIKLAADAQRILQSPLTFVEKSQYQEVNLRRKLHWFPIGRLRDDVEIHFLHYVSADEAADKWGRRLERTHFDSLFFKLSGDKDLFTTADLATFDSLPIAKIALSKERHPLLRSVITIPEYVIDGKAMYAMSLQYFDIVAWLNAGTK